MFTALLRSQWKTSALLALVLSLVAFGIPILQLLASTSAGGGVQPQLAIPMIGVLVGTGPAYPIFALFTGLVIATATGWDDQQGKFVYALILPVPRWYYLLLRLAVGFTFLSTVVVALWLSATIASAQVTLPPGLHAYPGGLTVRFALAAGIAFAATFALASASQRFQRALAWSVIGVLTLTVIFGALGAGEPLFEFSKRFVNWSMVLDSFTGRWVLFDV